MGAPFRVFISYSHKDEALRAELDEHLALLIRERVIATWHDRHIRAGEDWKRALDAELEAADVVLLLVSPAFIASDYCYGIEMTRALERHENGETRVIPVIVRPCDWKSAPFAKLQGLPKDGRAVTSWRSHDQAWVEVVKGLRAAIGAPTGAASADSALHQLRSPPADFTGRDDELEDLRKRIDTGGAIIAGLTGQGGVGKTALALRLAADLRDRYPDAQIDIDLRGADPKPLEPADVMAEVIRAFQPKARLPEGVDALGRLYRSVLDTRRVLLLFDNARDRAHVEPLVPPPRCLMLVTSRQHFTLPGIYTQRLDTLAEADAVALVRTIAPRLDEATAGELAKLCTYLPLALRAAASTLAERVDMKPAKYLQRLLGAERVKLVETVLASSLEMLEEAPRDFWLRLGVMPTDFDVPAAAAVGGVEPTEAEEHLGELVRRSLLDWDEPAERYRLHDLARDYARLRHDAEARYDAERRHAEHFREIARAAERTFLKGGAEVLEGLSTFDREWPHINAAQAWASEHAEIDAAAAAVCSGLPLTAPRLLDMRLPPRRLLAWLESALASARQIGDRVNEAQLLGNLGIAYWTIGDARRAIGAYEKVLAITQELRDRHGEGMTLGNLGSAYLNLNETQKAMELFEQSLAIARELRDRRTEGTALNNLGVGYKRLGNVHKAIGFFQQRLDIARELGDPRGECEALGNLGSAYEALGDTQRSIEFDEQVLTITRELGDRAGEATASWNLGCTYDKLGNLRRAADMMQVMVDFAREVGHLDLPQYEARIADVRARLGEVLLPDQECPCGRGRPFLECHGDERRGSRD